MSKAECTDIAKREIKKNQHLYPLVEKFPGIGKAGVFILAVTKYKTSNRSLSLGFNSGKHGEEGLSKQEDLRPLF